MKICPFCSSNSNFWESAIVELRRDCPRYVVYDSPISRKILHKTVRMANIVHSRVSCDRPKRSKRSIAYRILSGHFKVHKVGEVMAAPNTRLILAANRSGACSNSLRQMYDWNQSRNLTWPSIQGNSRAEAFRYQPYVVPTLTDRFRNPKAAAASRGFRFRQLVVRGLGKGTCMRLQFLRLRAASGRRHLTEACWARPMSV